MKYVQMAITVFQGLIPRSLAHEAFTVLPEIQIKLYLALLAHIEILSLDLTRLYIALIVHQDIIAEKKVLQL